MAHDLPRVPAPRAERAQFRDGDHSVIGCGRDAAGNWMLDGVPFWGPAMTVPTRWSNEIRDGPLDLAWTGGQWPQGDEAHERGMALANLEWAWLADLVRDLEALLADSRRGHVDRGRFARLMDRRLRLRAVRRAYDLRAREVERNVIQAARVAWDVDLVRRHIEDAVHDVQERIEQEDRDMALRRAKLLNRIAMAFTALGLLGLPGTAIWFAGNGISWAPSSGWFMVFWATLTVAALLWLVRISEPEHPAEV